MYSSDTDYLILANDILKHRVRLDWTDLFSN